jgi:hypothetical protein
VTERVYLEAERLAPKPPRLIDGDWTAMGHSFDGDMICVGCGMSWHTHQSLAHKGEPSPCPNPKKRHRFAVKKDDDGPTEEIS